MSLIVSQIDELNCISFPANGVVVCSKITTVELEVPVCFVVQTVLVLID